MTTISRHKERSLTERDALDGRKVQVIIWEHIFSEGGKNHESF